jgi:hypothetical protein
MNINDSKIQAIIDDRRRRDSELFFIDVCSIGREFGYDYTRKKKYHGLSLNGDVVVIPIFDEVLCLSKSVVALKVENKIAIYNLENKEFISQFDYVRIERENSYWKLISASKEVALFDSLRNLFWVNLGYTEYGIRQDNSQYIWAKRGKFFDYIKRDSGQIISLPGIVMAYDSQYGMFGKDEFGKISYFEESGVENSFKLREIVNEAGGYLTLNNFTYKIEDIIDVYGNILNI